MTITVLETFTRHKKYITSVIEFPYFNIKLEATNKLTKDTKRNAFNYRNIGN
ncbi:hypothetical protein GP482_02480 [Streptococcus ruminicola]|uniref:Transposase IS204/IS1001/IS1096/IS1165 DDE domain-containing protein n=1 Tax=Streptococcus ruminicola TaxID=2686210 RepID=A0AAE6UZN2_9STRE|nr:hypothetical protein GP482_02480 [Streptococcus ruminicola]